MQAAFGDHQVYAARERLALSGREQVVAVADMAFNRLKTFRDGEPRLDTDVSN